MALFLELLEDWIVHENAHEPLISIEQYTQVKKLLKDNLLVPAGARKRKFSLSNILKCGKCGRNMIFHHVRNKEYLKPCANMNYATGEKCGNGAIPMKDIEKYLKNQILSVAGPAVLHVKEKIANGQKYLSQVEIDRNDLLKQERDINSQLDNILPWSSPNCARLDFPFTLCIPESFFNDAAEFTLCYDLYSCSPCFVDRYFILPLSTPHYCDTPGLANGLLGNYPYRTCTGKCGSASLDAPLNKKGCCKNHNSC